AEKTLGLHYSHFETRPLVSTRLPKTPTSKNQRFLRWVEKVGLGSPIVLRARPIKIRDWWVQRRTGRYNEDLADIITNPGTMRS
ncbi:MAG: hypothetical protein ACREXS_19980, partial [Gammaproteobacteria bacterium]